jgi:hypothetical protein
MACAHETPLGRSICALKWALQEVIARFFLGAGVTGAASMQRAETISANALMRACLAL